MAFFMSDAFAYDFTKTYDFTKNYAYTENSYAKFVM